MEQTPPGAGARNDSPRLPARRHPAAHMNISCRLLLSASLLFTCWPTSAAKAAEWLPLHGRSVYGFASPEEAATLLGRVDRFTSRLSRFDMQCRLQTRADVTREQFLAFASQQALPWTDQDRQKIEPLMAEIIAKLRPYTMRFPDYVLLIKTTGKEEAGAAYTRRPGIILPRDKLNLPAARLQRLLVHELFHLFSSADQPLRTRMYESIGFVSYGAVALPKAWEQRRITNPDGPVEAFIKVEVDGQTLTVAPILFAKTAEYDPSTSASLFESMKLWLMPVDAARTQPLPLLQGKDPWLLEPGSVKSYFDQIGRNTNYIIHPDEILADNFVHLVFGTEDLPSPHIVDRLEALLQAR